MGACIQLAGAIDDADQRFFEALHQLTRDGFHQCVVVEPFRWQTGEGSQAIGQFGIVDPYPRGKAQPLDDGLMKGIDCLFRYTHTFMARRESSWVHCHFQQVGLELGAIQIQGARRHGNQGLAGALCMIPSGANRFECQPVGSGRLRLLGGGGVVRDENGGVCTHH